MLSQGESLEGSAPEEAAEPESFDPGQAGASARREYERRKAKDEQRVRERFGRFSGIALAIRDERHTTAVWEQGAVGEERLGGMLDGLREHGILAMHDRRIPKSRANIDHIAVTPGGIWVIDAKRYKGRPGLLIEGGILRPRTETLVVGSRNCSKLVDGMLWQMDLVTKAMPDIPVKGVLCFIGSDWSLLSKGFTTRGVKVVWPRLLKKRLLEDVEGDLDVDSVARQVARSFQTA